MPAAPRAAAGLAATTMPAAAWFPRRCPAPCLADAAADFDGTSRRHRQSLALPRRPSRPDLGGDDRERDRDDRRRSGNHITTCAAKSTRAGLQGAAGRAAGVVGRCDQPCRSSARADRGQGPGAQAERPRLCRQRRRPDRSGSTATAARTCCSPASRSPGAPLDQAVTVDALPGDRFLVALAPMTKRRDRRRAPGVRQPHRRELPVGLPGRPAVHRRRGKYRRQPVRQLTSPTSSTRTPGPTSTPRRRLPPGRSRSSATPGTSSPL